MNNPFHRAALRAFVETLVASAEMLSRCEVTPTTLDAMRQDFERRLEDQARAFDACKRGSEISMATLSQEMTKALYLVKARLKIDGNWAAAERAFNDHMKPHLEIRLW